MKPLLNKLINPLWALLFVQIILVKAARGQTAYNHLAFKQTIDTMRAATLPKFENRFEARAKTFTALGIVTMTSGITMVAIGARENIQTNIHGFFVGTGNNGVWLVVLGTMTAISSKVFFTAAKHNRLNAKLALQHEGLSIGNSTIYKSGYMAMSLKISF